MIWHEEVFHGQWTTGESAGGCYLEEQQAPGMQLMKMECRYIMDNVIIVGIRARDVHKKHGVPLSNLVFYNKKPICIYRNSKELGDLKICPTEEKHSNDRIRSILLFVCIEKSQTNELDEIYLLSL